MPRAKKQTKSKNNSKKSKKTTKPRQPSSLAMVPSIKIQGPPRNFRGDPELTMSSLKALLNPFCAEARGRKWPDGNGEATMTFQCRTMKLLSNTSVTGNALCYFNADPLFNSLDVASITANVWTIGAGWNASTSGSLSTYGNLYRTVSAGIIVRNIQAPLSASGYIIITRQSRAPAFGGTTAGQLEYGTDVNVFPIKAGMEVPMVFKPLGVTARQMSAASTTTVLTTGLQWDTLKVELVGAATTGNNLAIEIITNVEFSLPDSQESLTQLSPTSAPFSRALCDLSDKVSGKVATTVVDSLIGFGKKVAGYAAEGIMTSYYGPAAGKLSKATVQALLNDSRDVD